MSTNQNKMQVAGLPLSLAEEEQKDLQTPQPRQNQSNGLSCCPLAQGQIQMKRTARGHLVHALSPRKGF